MKGRVSSFAQMHRSWIMREVLSTYMRAMNMFSNMDREAQSGNRVKFESLKKLSDLLYSAKEDLYLIFERIAMQPSEQQFGSQRCKPNSQETEFINNVGLLFHKVMVLRELQYLREYYLTDREDITQTMTSMQTYWAKIRYLFEEGIILIKRLLSGYAANVLVLLYLMENSHYIKDSLNESIDQLLRRITGEEKLGQTFLKVADYCVASGWHDRARKILGEGIKLDPNDLDLKMRLRALA